MMESRKERYRNYKSNRLLLDDYFLSSQLHPTEESVRFWEGFCEEQEGMRNEIELAKSVLSMMDDSKEELSGEETEALWQRIEQQGTAVSRRKKRKKRLLFYSVALSACVACLICCFVSKQLLSTDDAYKINPNALVEADAFADKIRIVQGKKNVRIVENAIEINQAGLRGTAVYSVVGADTVKSILSEPAASPGEEMTIITPYGKQVNVILSDGTKVWLNSNSRIRYPARFKKEVRQIEVEGEVFLEVAKDEGKPFIVKTKEMNVLVRGTSFNVRTYKEEQSESVVLVSGKVEVLTADQESFSLSPSMKLELNPAGRSVRKVNVDDYVSWKKGYYLFKEVKLNAILSALANYYGIGITYDNLQIESTICSGKLDLLDDPSELLLMLSETSPVKFNIKKGEKSFQLSVPKEEGGVAF